ncbi:hypothetical protein [Undibacterium sp. TJN19]|uniref:hypothetical protein n=1 Tax=Undibacterium sp. TJN19 TaxID=3413055 RepID=UPI003BF5DCA5
MNEPKLKPEYFSTDWFKALHAETKAKSISAVALKMGVARPTLSVFINGLGAYGDGSASPANLEIRYRKAYEQLTCPHTGSLVGATHCRETALRTAPSHNPMQMMQWQACQSCPHKPAPMQEPKATKTTSKKSARDIQTDGPATGKASSGSEAEDEGWHCIGGPMDNPYPIEDSRHDYWERGYKGRREFNKKLKDRDSVQQAGIIDTVTLPLPEVGGPQIREQTNEVGA